jgi:hypothetical protein
MKVLAKHCETRLLYFCNPVQDCEQQLNAKCHEITCEIGELSENDYVTIKLRARVWNSTFLRVRSCLELNEMYPIEVCMSSVIREEVD